MMRITNILRFRFCSQAKQNEIIAQLKAIRMEDGGDIYTDGFVTSVKVMNEKNVQIELKLSANYRKMKNLSQEAIEKIGWVKNLDIKMAQKEASTDTKAFKRGNLGKVEKIIAVSSCKGGVGKSTVALNLAFSLHKMGKKIGIFDADIYGPSLPTLLAKEQETLQAPEDNPKDVYPIEYEGVKAMSYGFANGGKRAVLRGPMVSSIVTQLAYQTLWGELDYLIVYTTAIIFNIRDMPPGTGDIQITLCQELRLDAAVIVTTPQRLSFVDVVKGIEMFDVLKVPTIAVVENMAQFDCTECGHSHRPFGPGYLGMLQKQFGIVNSHSIPLLGEIAKYSDLGSPVVMTLPDTHPITMIYQQLAEGVVKETSKDGNQIPHVRYDTGTRQIIVRAQDGKEKKIKASTLRKQCGCALCVDEWSGKKVLQDNSVSDDVYPYKMETKGNYAIAMIWSDGHKSSIYPYDTLWKDIESTS